MVIQLLILINSEPSCLYIQLEPFLHKQVNEAKMKVREDFNAEAYVMVSDNAPNMVACGNVNAHHMWFSRCMSHIGNLIAKDIVKEYPITKTDVNTFSLLLTIFSI